MLIVLVSSGVFYFKYFNFIHRLSLLNAGIADPYSASFGNLVLNDPLSDNSLGNFWGEGVDSDGSSCEFINGTYHAIATAQVVLHVCTGNVNVGDFAYQVQATIEQGNSAGIIFRADTSSSYFYYFHIGVDQSYALDIAKVDGYSSNLTSGSNTTINGQGQSNTIAVVANGSTIGLYVNGQQIDSVTDSTYSQGYVGVAASNSTEAVFSNAVVWTA